MVLLRDVLQLSHVFLGCLFGEGPRQHELRLKHRARLFDDSCTRFYTSLITIPLFRWYQLRSTEACWTGGARKLALRLRSAVANAGGLSVSDSRQERALTPDSRLLLLNAVQHFARHPLHACERRRATGCGGELY
jgi:hypothetical protein